MNRADEIQAMARSIAEQTHPVDPIARNALADQLIQLCALVVKAVGKSVAVDGEGSMNDDDDETGYVRYRVGEDIQEGARWVCEEAVGADLERYERAGLERVWSPSAATLSGAWAIAPLPVADDRCVFQVPGLAVSTRCILREGHTSQHLV